MDTQSTLTEADILNEVVEPSQPDLPKELAQAIVHLRFHGKAIARLNELAEKNRQGSITTEERADLEKYLRVGNFLNLLRAKALASLRETEKA
jgi:uncharacterized protein YnzC (UPF0291/DUF896 family)